MDPSRMTGLWRALLLCTLCSWDMATAQTVSPVNSTTAPEIGQMGQQNNIQLAIGHTPTSSSITVFPLAALTPFAQQSTPETGFRGGIVLANASSQLTLADQNVALISCDPYTGNLQPSDVLGTAEDRNVSAIVLYSEHAAGCMLDNAGSYDRVYTMTSTNSTKEMLDVVNGLNTNNPGAAFAYIAPRDAVASNSQNNGSNSTGSGQSNNQTNPLGPAPTTAVAMIILYSITGVITALFLVIIITGAVRAHRHPERYGPRNGVGRPARSRARGLAMAMLETIPIVKFSDPQQDPKSSDIELASGRHGQVEVVPEQDAINPAPHVPASEETYKKDATHEEREPETPLEGGIGGAVAGEQSAKTAENQGCSICTEDFQVGEDQRVLPCDHRFHPACIDPWLLNVSGTCPLCRIDLRPDANRSSIEDETNENGDPALREGEPGEMAPPLAEQNGQRASVRRSILLGVMGVRRPERMTREERLMALRQYHAQQNARRVADRHNSAVSSSAPVAEQQEEETSMRRRLRNAFRIRTRRTGQQQEVNEEEQLQETQESNNDDEASRR